MSGRKPGLCPSIRHAGTRDGGTGLEVTGRTDRKRSATLALRIAAAAAPGNSAERQQQPASSIGASLFKKSGVVYDVCILILWAPIKFSSFHDTRTHTHWLTYIQAYLLQSTWVHGGVPLSPETISQNLFYFIIFYLFTYFIFMLYVNVRAVIKITMPVSCVA